MSANLALGATHSALPASRRQHRPAPFRRAGERRLRPAERARPDRSLPAPGLQGRRAMHRRGQGDADRVVARPRPRRVRGPRSAGLSGSAVAYRIALVGNPNTGKTTLFNRLSGARAKTSNFPGTTTAARIGRATLANGVGAGGRRDRRPAGPLPARPVDARIDDLPRSARRRGPVPQARRGGGRRRRLQPDPQPGARRRAARLRRAGRRRAQHGRPRPAARPDPRRRGAVPGDRLSGRADRRAPRRGRRSPDGGRRRRAETRRVAHAARPRRPTRRSRRGPTRRSPPASPASARAATR